MFPSYDTGYEQVPDWEIRHAIARLSEQYGISPEEAWRFYQSGALGTAGDFGEIPEEVGTEYPVFEDGTIPPSETIPPDETTLPPDETIPPPDETGPPPDETVPPPDEMIPPIDPEILPPDWTPPEETLPPPEETPPPPPGQNQVEDPGRIDPFWSSRNPYWNMRFDPPRAPNYAGAPIYHDPSGQNIDRIAANNRLLALGRGDELNADYRDLQHYYFGQAADYEMWLAGAYQDILQGRGGYSQEERDGILREAELYGLNLTPEEYDANYLRDWEYAGVRGAPEEMISRLQEGMAAQDEILTQSTARRREALAAQDERLRGRQADQEGRLRAGLDWQDAALRNALQIEEGDIYGGLGWQEQMLSDALAGQAGNIRGAYGRMAGGVRSVVDPGALGLSQEFREGYKFGPEDEQRLVDQAARSVQASRQATEDEINRRLAAQGTVNPAAYAAMINRARLTGEVNQADAMTDARVRAREVALNTLMNREQERLNAERFSQGFQSDLELALGGAELGAEQYLGESELDTGRYMGGSRLAATAGLGSARRGTEEYLGGSRLNTEQYLGGSGLDTERYLAASRLGTEGEIGSDWLRSQMQLTPLAVDTQERVDAAQRGASMWLAANRQDTERYNQGQRYQRGLSIYDRASGANQLFANQRLNELAEYRNWLANMQKNAGAQSTEAGRLRLGAFGTSIGGANEATRNQIYNYATPGMGERIAKMTLDAAARAGGAALGNPNVFG